MESYMHPIDDREDTFIDCLLVRQAMEKLSPEENRILYYKYWECLTIREIAEKLDKPRSTIQYKVDEILKKLKAYCDLGGQYDEKEGYRTNDTEIVGDIG